MQVLTRAWLAAIIFPVVFLSCKKSSLLGVDVLPGTDAILGTFTDTFTLETTTVRDDSVLTSSSLLSLSGNMYDPVFGSTLASFFAEFDLPSNDINLGNPDTLTLDSIVLALDYAGFYGYEDVAQSVMVHELEESISPIPATGYYSNQSFAHSPRNILGRKINFVPNTADSMEILGRMEPAQLRIRLSNWLGRRFLNQSGDSGLTDLEHFHQFFKGIVVGPDTLATTLSGGIMYFDLSSYYSGLLLYYHSANVDSLGKRFLITPNVAKTNFYQHDYTGSVVEDHLKPLAHASDSTVFMQPLGGLKTRIRIPNIHNLKNVLINKAELVVTQVADAAGSDTIFKPPIQLVAVESDFLGKDIILPDALFGFPAFGGSQHTVTNSAGQEVAQYKFSIARQLQQIIDEESDDYGLSVILYRRGDLANRLMAEGANRADDTRLKLNIIYTPIE